MVASHAATRHTGPVPAVVVARHAAPTSQTDSIASIVVARYASPSRCADSLAAVVVARHAASKHNAGPVPAIVVAASTDRLHAHPGAVVVVPRLARPEQNAGPVASVVIASRAPTPHTCPGPVIMITDHANPNEPASAIASIVVTGSATAHNAHPGAVVVESIRASPIDHAEPVPAEMVTIRAPHPRAVDRMQPAVLPADGLVRESIRRSRSIRARQVESGANLRGDRPLRGTVANPAFHDHHVPHPAVQAAGAARVYPDAICAPTVNRGVAGCLGTPSATQNPKCNCQHGSGRPSNASHGDPPVGRNIARQILGKFRSVMCAESIANSADLLRPWQAAGRGAKVKRGDARFCQFASRRFPPVKH